MLVSAKTVQATLPLLFLVAVAGAFARGRWRACLPPLNGATILLAAFLLYALLSASWAHAPQMSAMKAAIGIIIVLGTIVVMQALGRESHGNVLHIAEGLWLGLLVGLVYAVIEVVSDQAVKIGVYNALGLGPEELEPDRFFTWENGRLVAVHPDDLKRNLVPAALLLWPALIAARTIAMRGLRVAVTTSLLALAGVAIFFSPSNTCMLALIAGLITFLCASYLPRLTLTGLMAVWVVACLGIIPIVLGARALELQDAGWLPVSAQLRVVIWNEIAHLVADAPVFGVGANMTYVSQPPLHEAPTAAQSWLGFPIPHPHNVYLQTWYELGAIGAGLLAAFGVALLRQINTVGGTVKPFLYATFSAAAVEIGMSYNSWQIWFMCLFGFAAAMCALSLSVVQLRSNRVV